MQSSSLSWFTTTITKNFELTDHRWNWHHHYRQSVRPCHNLILDFFFSWVLHLFCNTTFSLFLCVRFGTLVNVFSYSLFCLTVFSLHRPIVSYLYFQLCHSNKQKISHSFRYVFTIRKFSSSLLGYHPPPACLISSEQSLAPPPPRVMVVPASETGLREYWWRIEDGWM